MPVPSAYSRFVAVGYEPWSSIQDPGARPTQTAQTAPQSISGTVTNASGTTLFYTEAATRAFTTTASTALTNAGTIWVENLGAGVTAIEGNYSSIVNAGTILAVSGAGAVRGLLSGASSLIQNDGTVRAIAFSGSATGYWVQRSTAGSGGIANANSGMVEAWSADNFAVGIQLTTFHEFTNSGQISATGFTSAVGIGVQEANTSPNGNHFSAVTNSATGVISAHSSATGADSIGVLFQFNIFAPASSRQATFTNYGVVTAEIAVGVSERFNTITATVINAGTLNGQVILGSGEDHVDTILGTITGSINLNDGNDLFLGGAGSDSVFGGRGNDALFGGNGADSLDGGDGDDVLYGGTGTNSLISGNGNDVLVSDSSTDTLFGGEGSDTYILNAGGGTVSDLGASAGDLVYSYGSLVLGSGIESGVILGTGSNLTGNGSNNLLIGNTANNTISGGLGNDVIYGVGGTNTLSGENGDDVLVSGAGVDVMIGGSGDDVFIIESGDTVSEAVFGGRDTVYVLSGNFVMNTAQEIEVVAAIGAGALVGNQFNNTLIGDGGNNNLIGGGGADFLVGGGGNDFLQGGEGLDTMQGHGGADTYVYRATNELGDIIQDWIDTEDQFLFVASVFGFTAGQTLVAGTNFFASTAPTATGTGPSFLWDTDDTNLFFDADGSGAGAAVLVADLQAFTNVTVSDFIFTASAEDLVAKDVAIMEEVFRDEVMWETGPVGDGAIWTQWDGRSLS